MEDARGRIVRRQQRRVGRDAGPGAAGADAIRERLWELLILALYRQGRQGDALQAFREARAELREDAASMLRTPAA